MVVFFGRHAVVEQFLISWRLLVRGVEIAGGGFRTEWRKGKPLSFQSMLYIRAPWLYCYRDFYPAKSQMSAPPTTVPLTTLEKTNAYSSLV